jgi:hypothetical protein
VGNPEGKRPLRRSTSRWWGNIKIELRAIEWCGTDWINVA